MAIAQPVAVQIDELLRSGILSDDIVGQLGRRLRRSMRLRDVMAVGPRVLNASTAIVKPIGHLVGDPLAEQLFERRIAARQPTLFISDSCIVGRLDTIADFLILRGTGYP